MIAADGGQLDRLADALRVDGVVVEQSMGAGEAEQAHDRIAALVRETPFPVYVALVADTRGVAGAGVDVNESLAGLLHRRLGDEQALFVVDSPEGIAQVVSFGLGADPSLLSLSASADQELLRAGLEEAVVDEIGHGAPLPSVVLAEAWAQQVEELVAEAKDSDGDVYPPTLTDDEVDRLVEVAVPLATRSDWRPDVGDFVEVRAASRGFSWLVSLLAGMVVALLLGQSLRGWPSPRGAKRRQGRSPAAVPEPTTPAPEAARRKARQLVGALAEELAAVDWTVVDREWADRADAARVAAEMLLDSDDVGDLLGAQALARTGSVDLRRAQGEDAAYRPCFFDPRHGDAGHTVGWRLGQGRVDVPCCGECSRVVEAGRRPQPLRLPGRRGAQAYWKRDDVWARTGFGAVTDTLARDVLSDREARR
ncbi:hypothetical protein [Nocardioides daphniae]|uniref:Uncharacterized protein n=1 Tax=Nocardioides daphniae TaxID=402297 RepID=A0A4P7U946_9ACTN|nr:hypothetical protein [Nocardioides daphniae]QCC76673.1 hypothetical protein E2C04_04595 [Nocardioides daphniae]GGD15219.1 hypothetical protein GCM10007231_12780 [Nocardioides daphniae]